MDNSERRNLPVFRVLSDSILIPWRNRKEFSTALAMPTLIWAVTWAFSWTLLEPDIDAVTWKDSLSSWSVWLINKGAFAIFAVACHRLILVEESPRSLRVSFSMREIKFLGWIVAISGICLLIIYVPLNLAVNISVVKDALGMDSTIDFVPLIFAVPALYMLARLCLVFPATAIDIKLGLIRSWFSTRQNGWRIVAIVGLYPWLIGTIIWLVSREDATLLEQVVTALLFYLGTALEIFALSLTYKTLVGSERSGILGA